MGFGLIVILAQHKQFDFELLVRVYVIQAEIPFEIQISKLNWFPMFIQRPSHSWAQHNLPIEDP